MGKRGKPRVIVRCVANVYTGVDERIIEVSFSDGSGALVGLRQPRDERRASIEVYRTNGAVQVTAPREEVARQAEADRRAFQGGGDD